MTRHRARLFGRVLSGLPWRAAFLGLLLLGDPARAQDAGLEDPALEIARQAALEARREALEEFRPAAAPPDRGPDQAAGGPCFPVETIDVTGITVLPPAELGTLVRAYVPSCLQGANIQALMQDLDAAYAEAGYITSRTYIPPQNLNSGRLTLTVIEGVVEDLFLIDADTLIETRRGRWQLATAFPGARGKVFRLRDFEQGLDQMNRLPSVEARMRLQPGDTPGGSYVIIQRVQEDRFRSHLTWDNYGSASTGRNRMTLSFAADDLIGANDTWSFGITSSLNTNALSFAGSVPYGYSRFNLSMSYGEYLVQLTDTAELFGRSFSGDLGWTYLAHRDQASSTTFDLGLQIRRSERFVNAATLTPQNLAVFKAGLSHLRQDGETRLGFDLALKAGIAGFGADQDAATPGATIPRAQFLKLEAGAFRIGKIGDHGHLATDLRLQYAPHPLYSAEQLALGSRTTVRGYEGAVAIGDTGAYIRNDYYVDAGALLGAIAERPWLKGLQGQAFFDIGATYNHASGRWQGAAGVGIGLSYEWNRFKSSVSLASPLLEDGAVTLGSPVLSAQVSIKLF